MKDLFGVLGVAFMMGSSVPYLIALFKKEIRPHAFSWLLWCMINMVVLAAQWTEGAGSGMWPTVGSALVTGSIGLYALKWGERRYTRSDWIFMFMALMAIPLWALTRDPLLSVVLVCIIDILAFMPTITKSWRKPHEENALSFVIGAAGFLSSLLAIEQYQFVNYAYPTLVMTANLLFVSMLILRRRQLARD